MPIKQSTDIRYNAPKHLEERYNITKVSEASAYQYPDGALHYFTEDCTDYPKGLYKYDGTKWEQFDLGGAELTQDQIDVITQNGMNGLHVTLDSCPRFIDKILVNEDGTPTTVTMSMFGLDGYTTLTEAREAGIIDSSNNLVSCPEGFDLPTYDTIKNIFSNVFDINKNWTYDGKSFYCAKWMLRIPLGDCTSVVFITKTICRNTKSRQLGFAGAYLYYDEENGIVSGGNLYPEAGIIPDANGTINNGGTRIVIIPKQIITTQTLTHIYRYGALHDPILTLLGHDPVAMVDVIDNTTSDADIPSVGAIRKYLGEGGGSDGGSGLTEEQETFLNEDMVNGLQVKTNSYPRFIDKILLDDSYNALEITLSSFGLSNTITLEEAKASGLVDANDEVVNVPDGLGLMPFNKLVALFRESSMASANWRYKDGHFINDTRNIDIYAGACTILLFPSKRVGDAPAGGATKIVMPGYTITYSSSTGLVSVAQAVNTISDHYFETRAVVSCVYPFVVDESAHITPYANSQDPTLSLLKYNKTKVVRDINPGTDDLDIPSVGALKKYVGEGGGNSGGGSGDVVDMSDFVKGERRGGDISFSYDHTRTPLPNSLERKTYGELEEMGLIRSDGCLLLSACYYGGATMEELGYFVNHVEFKYDGGFFVAYAKDERWVISTYHIDSIVLLSRNTCFMGYDVPPYYYGYEISYDVDEEEWVATEVTVENGCPCRVPFKAVMGNEEVTLELPSPQTKVFHLAPDGRLDDYYNFDSYADQLPTVGTVKYMLEHNNNGSGDGGLTSEQRELLESLKNEDGTNRLDTIEESIDPSIPARVQSIEQWKGTLNILSVEREAEGEWVINVLAQQ